MGRQSRLRRKGGLPLCGWGCRSGASGGCGSLPAARGRCFWARTVSPALRLREVCHRRCQADSQENASVMTCQSTLLLTSRSLAGEGVDLDFADADLRGAVMDQPRA